MWHDSRSGVRERGDCLTGSGGSVSRCGVCPTIQDRVWPCERGTWLTGVWRWRWWPVGEGYGWLTFEDEDGGRRMWLAGVWRWRWWEREDEDGGRRMWLADVWRWRWIDFVTDVKLWIVSWGSGSGARRRTAGAGVWMLGLRKVTRFFFVFIVPLKPNRFGSVGVFPVSGFWNRTEPKIFAKTLIGLISFFFVRFFRLFFSRFIRFLGFFAHP